MERAEGPQTPYEAYCYHCMVTSPVGTRRCIHCGGPVGRRGLRTGPQLPAELHVEEDAPAEAGMGRRLGGLSLWILLAIGAALSRMCSG